MSRLPKPETELRKARTELRRLRRENEAQAKEIRRLEGLVRLEKMEANKWEERFDTLLKEITKDPKRPN